MAKKVIFKNNVMIDGLGYLDMQAEEREEVYGNDILYILKEDRSIEIAGNQIQLVDFKLNSDCELGHVKYGRGNNGNGTEGAKYKNVIFTNALGPVLVRNPWYTEKIIRQAMKTKNMEIKKPKLEFELENESLESLKKFINAKGK